MPPCLPRECDNHDTTYRPRETSIHPAPNRVRIRCSLFFLLPSLQGAQGKVGLLVSERMINCPMQAVPKLHEALVEDIAWAVENEVIIFPPFFRRPRPSLNQNLLLFSVKRVLSSSCFVLPTYLVRS